MIQNNFGQDVEFLKKYVETIVLTNGQGGQVAVVPDYQGRTMTCTPNNDLGNSYGWINYDLIASGQRDPVVNLYGGEDRFWISPEGGQFSLFFDPDDPMDLAHWRTPALIDTEPFDVVAQDESSVAFQKRGQMTNYSRFTFDMQFDRKVIVPDPASAAARFSINLDGLRAVAHESHNRLNQRGGPGLETGNRFDRDLGALHERAFAASHCGDTVSNGFRCGAGTDRQCRLFRKTGSGSTAGR